MFVFFIKRYKESKRNYPVDFLRGISILLVMVGHFYYMAWSPSASVSLPASYYVDLFLFNSPYGVSMFFAISGYLITTRLLEQTGKELNNISIPVFYLSRFSRIFPALILLCLFNYLFFFWNIAGFQIAPFTWQTLLSYIFTFRANILFLDGSHGLLPWGILWSLAIEEVFYLLYPWLCIVLRSSYIIFALVFIVLYGLWCRSESLVGSSSLRFYFGCFDQLALGCIAALLAHTNWFYRCRLVLTRMLSLAGLVLVTYIYFKAKWTDNYIYGPTLMGLGASLYLLGFSKSLKEPLYPRWKKLSLNFVFPVCLLGMLSYELYLFHEMTFLLVKPFMDTILLKTGWSLFYFIFYLVMLTLLLIVLAGVLYFSCLEPIRKKIIKSLIGKLSFLSYIPRLFRGFELNKSLER